MSNSIHTGYIPTSKIITNSCRIIDCYCLVISSRSWMVCSITSTIKVIINCVNISRPSCSKIDRSWSRTQIFKGCFFYSWKRCSSACVTAVIMVNRVKICDIPTSKSVSNSCWIINSKCHFKSSRSWMICSITSTIKCVWNWISILLPNCIKCGSSTICWCEVWFWICSTWRINCSRSTWVCCPTSKCPTNQTEAICWKFYACIIGRWTIWCWTCNIISSIAWGVTCINNCVSILTPKSIKCVCSAICWCEVWFWICSTWRINCSRSTWVCCPTSKCPTNQTEAICWKFYACIIGRWTIWCWTCNIWWSSTWFVAIINNSIGILTPNCIKIYWCTIWISIWWKECVWSASIIGNCCCSRTCSPASKCPTS